MPPSNLSNLSIFSKVISFSLIISFPPILKLLPIVASPLNFTLKASDFADGVPFPMTNAILLVL